MKRLNNKAVFVTRASSGIGAATANIFASKGANMILTNAKTIDRVKEQQGKLKTFGIDALDSQVDSSDALALQTAISMGLWIQM